MDFYKVGKKELCKHECDPHSLTRTRMLKGGWFGLTSTSIYVGGFHQPIVGASKINYACKVVIKVSGSQTNVFHSLLIRYKMHNKCNINSKSKSCPYPFSS